jgi:hypothetical protein
LSLLLVLFLIIYSIDFTTIPGLKIFDTSLLAINYFLIVEFFLTMLLVINRVYILLKKDSDVI